MILRLRRRHRRMVTALGVFLPIILVIGVAARKPVPSMAALPEGLAAAPEKFAAVEWADHDLFERAPIHAHLRRDLIQTNRFAVEFSIEKDFVKPDMLVYWITNNPAANDKLPENALLLGALNAPVILPLPAGATSGSGMLLIYSLANQQTVGLSSPFTLRKP